MRRCLFGPVTAALAAGNLRRQRQAGACLVFGPEGVDLAFGPDDTWESACARLPAGWRPDFVLLALPAGPVPVLCLSYACQDASGSKRPSRSARTPPP